MIVAKQYRTLWRRVVAGYADAFLFSPAVVADRWIWQYDTSIWVRAAWYVLIGSLGAAYPIYFHGRYGYTLGKRLLGIKVTDRAGGPLSTGQAVKRELINLPFHAWYLVAAVAVVLRGEHPQTPAAFELGTLSSYGLFLVALEALSALTNPKRRSLHDWLAGSVVVRVQRTREPNPEPA